MEKIEIFQIIVVVFVLLLCVAGLVAMAIHNPASIIVMVLMGGAFWFLCAAFDYTY